MSAPSAGVTLAGKYALGRRLGAGGYGAVYEGENLDLGKKVAIKLIERRHNRSEEAIARFRREARAGAMIESPNIAQVFDVGEDPTAGLYMIMELLRGDDLRRKLDRVQRVDVDFAVEVAHQIACGLAKAHAAGVVHRDLKPANVFLHEPSAEAGDEVDRVVVKIVDFGVAKLMDESSAAAAEKQPLTTAGKTVGTPQYMSPEQVQGFPYDHRADLWALGALLYEMLAGRPAFLLKDSFQETALAIVLEEPPSLRKLAPDTPASVVAVVERALAKEPADRYADAISFAEALVAARPRVFDNTRNAQRPPANTDASHPGAPTSDGAVLRDVRESVAREPPPDHRRRLGAVIAIGVLAAAAAVLVVAALRTSSRPSVPAAAGEPTPVASAAPTPVMPSASAAVPVASVAPSVSASIAHKPSTAPRPIVAAPKPAPASSSAAPPPKPEGDPFGSVGVSSSY